MLPLFNNLLKNTLILSGILDISIFYSSTAYAAVPDASAQQQIVQNKQQNLTSKQAQENLIRRAGQNMTKMPHKTSRLEVFSLPKEAKSFKIDSFYLKNTEYSQNFKWINKYLADFNGQYVGVKGINMLMDAINAEIINRGYITTRIYIEPQDLSSGRLYFSLQPGLIEDIRFRKETWGTYANAVPMQKGSLLNIRDVEQAIDNFNSVPGQRADIKIEPGSKEGHSDLVIDIERDKPWSFSFSLDNSGIDTTGKNQFTAAVRLSQPLSINDVFYASRSVDTSEAGDVKGTNAASFYYAVPLGKERFSFSHSQNDYHQTVTYAVNPFISSGRFTYDSFRWLHLLQRNQHSKTDFVFGIVHKTRHSYINGTEIGVQRQKTTAMQIGLNHRQYFGPSVLDASFIWQKGMPWFADPGVTDNLPGEATSRYNMYLFDADFTAPLHIAQDYDAQYNLSIRAQRTPDKVYGSEFFSIGDWYSVRGFDGEQNLSAENGFVLRNEIRFPFAQNQQFYLAFDYGAVSGPSAEYLLGDEMTGAAIGLRGRTGAYQYDAFIARPLKKPDGFKCDSHTFGFMISAEL